mgnify:CR=1 FL=1
MLRYFLILSFPFFIFSCNNSKEETSEQPVSKHSQAFNTSVQSALDSYDRLSEAFVSWDSTTALAYSIELRAKLDNIPLHEFSSQVKEKAKSPLDLAKRDLQVMSLNNTLTEKRRGLNSLTINLFEFLEAVQYDEKKIYLQECPMAFNDKESGFWLTDKGKDSIRNPYLGLYHPKYGKAMLSCGENKSAIDYTSKPN